ncbi:MAG: threonine synthase [Cyclobacteriaceae bacterium]|nr:threonine synthase [Cyclobacteriaceae bacterium]MCH8517685.1 threonine synthase [Cyclobacteriaceae bacterium]
MKYFSTKNNQKAYNFREAVLQGLPEDRGLFVPEHLPELSKEIIHRLDDYSLAELGHQFLAPYVGDVLGSNQLADFCEQTFYFPFPTVAVTDNIYSLELFHGPSYAFKDVGAKFLSLCLNAFYEDTDKQVTVLVATSGDTGGAVAAAFQNSPKVEVIILYPNGKVSDLQERQLCLGGDNVSAYAIDGTFDDCQNLVKQAFLDQDITKKRILSSANSINVARFIPQAVYYFAPFQVLGTAEELIFSVPSGNYGNLTAGLLAQAAGLPIGKMIAASNANDVVPRFLENGSYQPKTTIPTLSNAMDVGNPSNFVRMQHFFDTDTLQKKLIGYSANDQVTLSGIRRLKESHQYLADPHGIIAYMALENYLKTKNEKGVFLETAHPCKFQSVYDQLDMNVPLPESAASLYEQAFEKKRLSANYEDFKSLLMQV